ncbi:tRNA epoxyqueuosine(34) reductase QueG [Candidatus Peregrinibacteria bacterium]|nr:tRNA epoxyqueuosine(34) reductase QueG [Candidatus Peregrinibacteria bacterium]
MKQILLEKFIKRQGWSFFGVADREKILNALKEHHPVFRKWLKKGMEAKMEYLKRMENDRYHPDNKLPGFKSAIALAAWYGYEQKNCSKDRGRIARYAAGRDYHNVLTRKLKELARWLQAENPGAKTYVSVDSGPMVDRVIAAAAGLGFFGKNTCLIHPQKGSYFFIGVVLTDLDLTPTPSLRMPNCGDCRKCIEACPTGALVAPGVLDARKCIAYLTIENKGPIPAALRPKIGNRLFGCDACQEVCPFNLGRAHRQKILIKEFGKKYGAGPPERAVSVRAGESLDLKKVLSIKNDGEFLKRFAGTPLMRAKRKGLQRNARVVLGNAKGAC